MNSFYSEEELSKLGLKSYGKNVLISRNACIYGADNISIGNNVRIDDFSILSGNITIGNNVHVAAGVYLFGGKAGIEMHDYVGISSRCAIYAASDDYSGEYLTNPTVPDEYKNVFEGKVTLEAHSLVATGCTIMPGVTLHAGCSVGAMSLVNKDIPELEIHAGIPARFLKSRSNRIFDLAEKLESSKKIK